MKSLNIFGTKVTVKRAELASMGFDGLYCGRTKSITLDKDLEGKDFMKALLHEMVHAICDATGIRQANFSIDIEEILSENIANTFCEQLEIKYGNESTREKTIKKRRN